MADDGISGMVGGTLIGMDGNLLSRVAGKSDYALRDLKCKSVCEAVEPKWRRTSKDAASKALLCPRVVPSRSYAAAGTTRPAQTTMIGDSVPRIYSWFSAMDFISPPSEATTSSCG